MGCGVGCLGLDLVLVGLGLSLNLCESRACLCLRRDSIDYNTVLHLQFDFKAFHQNLYNCKIRQQDKIWMV